MSENIPYTNERVFQSDAFTWTWNQFPELRRLFFKVHNEGQKGIAQAMADRSMGLVPGIPDIVFVRPLMGIELKIEGGTLSKDQKKVHQDWNNAGINVFVAWNMEQYQNIVIRELERLGLEPLDHRTK